LRDVFAYIDAHRQKFLERLIDYVRKPSISAQGMGTGEVAEARRLRASCANIKMS